MKKSVVQEKSRGVLLFAFNTDIFNYVKIAEHSARIIRRTLGLPVTLVTERGSDTSKFDNVVYVNNTMPNVKPGHGTMWRNGDRYRAYELSPYDETILVDSDYLMLDKSLLKLFEQDFDYRIMSTNASQLGPWDDCMGTYSLSCQWATVVLFRKTTKSKMLFDLVGRIQRNYSYYWSLYHVKSGSFRNDFGFTIANNILNGYHQELNQEIQNPMLTYNEIIKSMSINKDLITIKEEHKAYIIPRQNLHIMDKEYLLSDDFSNFVDSICAE